MTREERLSKQRAKVLWCVHVLGPDELIAKESYEAAEQHAKELTDSLHGPDMPFTDVLCLPIVTVWPWSDGAHRRELGLAAARRSTRTSGVAGEGSGG